MKSSLFSLFTVIFLALGLIIFPRDAADAARNGLSLCANVVIPSLFPFFVLSAFVTESGLGQKLGRLLSPVMSRLFGVSGIGASALVLGLIGGYPIGASCVKALYEKQQCSKQEAEHLLAFCNNSGPSFLLGAVGAGVFGSIRVGLLLLFVHILSALTVGFLFRFRQVQSFQTEFSVHQPLPLSVAFCQAIKSGLTSALNVCAFIVFFSVLTAILHLFSLLPRSGVLGAFCTGVLEITSGIAALQTATPHLQTAFILAAALIGFGGVSIHAQSLSFLSQTDLSLKPYFLGKILHALLSALYAAIIARVFLQSTTVFAPMQETSANIPGLAVSLVAILSFCILLLFSEKRTGKR